MRSDKYSVATLVLAFLLLFASVEFFLLLRHKSPYVSDTYFYKHLMYSYSGKSFDQAYKSIVSQLDSTKLDEIEKNFYFNQDAYKRSLSFLAKRPFYPFLAQLLSYFLRNEHLALLIPVFIAYFLVILTFYHICRLGMSWFYATLATASFISFYPFIDLSTYFLTDTIGTAFWMGQLLCIYRYLVTRKPVWLVIFVVLLTVSILNREQNVLLLGVVGMMWILLKIHEQSYNMHYKSIQRVFLVTAGIIAIFFIISLVWGIRTLYDTIVYTMNQYGLLNNTYSLEETLIYQWDGIVRSHIHLVKDIFSRHWWAIYIFFGSGYAIRLLLRRKMILIDILMFSSAIFSYSAIYLYPVLSYRYFFPVIASIVYFFIKFIELLGGKGNNISS